MESHAVELLERALKSGMVAIDTEATGLAVNDTRDHCMGVSVAFREPHGLVAFYLPLRHTNVGVLQGENLPKDRILPLLQAINDNCLVIYCNAKYDLVSLWTLGLSTSQGRFCDIMILAHLVDENKPTTGKSLDSLARHYLNDDKGKRKSEDLKAITKNLGWGILTPGLLVKYATWDAALTYRVFESLQPILAMEDLGEVWLKKAEFLRLLIKMEGFGIRVDQSLCEEMAFKGHQEMDQLKAELGFNPASRKELEQVLIEEMGLPRRKSSKTGNQTFDKDAMAFYESILENMDDPIARHIIEFRGWQKSVSSNYEPYTRLLSPDGRIRSSFIQHQTVTGRLSNREPNLQQIPKVGTKPWNGLMRQCFVPAEGYALVSVDFSQLELRLATVYAQEPALIETFQAGRDIFTEMSKQLGMTRPDTKMLVYLMQYGGGPHRLSLSLKVDLVRARGLIANFHNTYPRFKAAADKFNNLAARYGQIQLWTGRRRHFLYPREEAHKAWNSLMQGGAADIVEQSLLKLDREGFNDGTDSRILLQIHDEGVFEIREELVETYSREIVNSMSTVDFHPRLQTVKFKAEAKKWAS